MTNYQVGDFLIRLKNAAMANIKEVVFPKTKLVLEVAKALKAERFLDSVEEKDGKIIVKLTIFSKKPVLSNVTIISRPGLRIYMSADEIEKIKTPDIYILTTPKGVISGKMAKKLRVGGEVIAKVI
ncbi:30S ribosomal protein S8 [Candidatus Woesebacteria bacterium RIFOXYC1_FULL_31_51]|uniref:Small ribosomal subunit protein uS8 n=1 Tax=Candidatus Woesebacteria bacterium GW2011_GWC2_31_9 TaxID=1618586 RepID=A0A0G0AZZ4_9BACT|nr:MAG: ribosomal protein S8 [Candidatus Woesebacteria bacterium GW2011_GWF1_31_35]KKP23327.1 MAG: 30S ribosomal protein S8 [Candidatus Woesebacteria bacterium GW2011_GWC1_30_29]KKP26155.1 MAG: 30S ribosomal protein S8 [Candidatus Woesebacteria bacterium GW2011_GWD1_31_12]KKP27588.1 MAG: 30S ribosomal protein S8 [Candidatus Woesebacteria bacterium GW2011_GWB1_31_29]KKP32105.1 MAG: 30S ribosomal protein S8 [Candidatus Woesebacteria bacterium GW2011_GWC2_31_9]KKP34355.1 MAG: 30S ribosomal protei